jgi:hypothetical protein
MKYKIYACLSCLCLGLLLVGSLNLTFTNPSREAKASIPFDFYVKDKKMPAGDYNFLESDSNHGVVWVEKTSNPDAAVTFASAEYPNKHIDQAKLIFHKYGNIYFLAELWNPVLDEKLTMFPSRTEKEAQVGKSEASSSAGPEMVVITLNGLMGHKP